VSNCGHGPHLHFQKASMVAASELSSSRRICEAVASALSGDTIQITVRETLEIAALQRDMSD
jgi:hypothetical protein